MAEVNSADKVVFLFDTFSDESKKLYTSYKLEGKNYPAVVIEENGFLPDGVQSVYGFFLGEYPVKDGIQGKPRYFNQIDIPDYWEIKSTNTSGQVVSMQKDRANIFYSKPTNKRLVSVVDWFDDNGKVRISEHFNRFGALYARTIFNKNGNRVSRSYFDANNREVIIENYVTKDIILNDGNDVRIFNNKTEFAIFAMKRMGYSDYAIYFNSLSYPFFVSEGLDDNGKKDVLFWQEPTGEEIPGNMRVILKGSSTRTGRIMVQRQDSYDKLMQLSDNNPIFTLRGYKYNYSRPAFWGNEALICTNSDNIEKLTEIVSAMPEITFHIAALTEMSSKLMDVGNNSNVKLYPGVKDSVLDELFSRCSLYLDINHEGEIVNAVERAFLANQLIFAFNETIHNKLYISCSRIFAAEDYQKMISAIRNVANDRTAYMDEIKQQAGNALSI